jgi:hypothetical protein
LQIRPESSTDGQASALGRLTTARQPSAAADTGVDVEFTTDPWQVHLVRTRLATAQGVKTIDYEMESSGPVLMHTAPFDLVLPSFPLQGSTSATLQSYSSSVGDPLDASVEQIEDSSEGGPTLGRLVRAQQQVSAMRVGDPMNARAESAAASLSGGTSSVDLNSGRMVQTRNGRSTARQLWVEGLPWALAEETAYSRTSLVELR